MQVDSFEATGRLDDVALRALLEGGRPEQRLWAAWRVALRVGAAVPHIVERVAVEPSAGVRRALVVVLAGHGEVDVLVALGRHDPAVEVRAYAMHFVTNFAGHGKIPPAVVVEAFNTGAAEVRRAILAGIPPGAPEGLLALAPEALAGGGPPDEQLEAFEAALRVGSPRLRHAAMRWLATTKGTLAFDAWGRLQDRPPAEIVELLLGTASAMRERALATFTRVPITELAPLALDGTTQMFLTLRERPDFAATPPDLLARAILTGCAAGFVERLTALLRTIDSAPEPLAALLPSLGDHVLTRRAALSAGREPLPDERPRRRWNARQAYAELFKQLQRFA